jgi:hypothetical protein
MHINMYVWMHINMYVCMDGWMDECVPGKLLSEWTYFIHMQYSSVYQSKICT